MKKIALYLTLLLISNLGFSNEQQDYFSSFNRENLDYENVNKIGIDLFYKEQFVSGLEIFKRVIHDYQEGRVNETDYGTALLGKTLCDAALDYLEDFYEDVYVIQWFFLQKHRCTCEKSNLSLPLNLKNISLVLATHHNQDWFDRPQGQLAPDTPAKFANPNEHVTIKDCINRVNSTASILKGPQLL